MNSFTVILDNFFDHRRRLILVVIFLPIFILNPPTAWSADYQKGLEAAKKGDFVSANREWRPLAEQGNANAQFSLGNMYQFGDGVIKDHQIAAQWYERAAIQGVAKAQYNLGFLYYNSQQLSRDDKVAVKWFRLAAEQGFLLAQTNLGVAYGEGRGIERNDILAHMWLNIAATRGERNAQANIKEIYRRMSRTDLVKARKLATDCVKSQFKGCGATAI